MCWLLSALLLWLSLSSCFDSIVVFSYATVQQPDDLKAPHSRSSTLPPVRPILESGSATARSHGYCFPIAYCNPKGRLKMTQLTDYAREQLKGCMATAKIRSVPSAFGRINQIWDLECPQTRIHYGPEAAASQITQNPRFDLVFNLIFDAFFLFGAYLLAAIALTLGKRSNILTATTTA